VESFVAAIESLVVKDVPELTFEQVARIQTALRSAGLFD
jgi:hypothetical protein